MGFLSGLVDTVKDFAGPIVGAVTGSPWLGAASSLPFMGSNDEYGTPTGTFGIGDIFSGFGGVAKDLFSAGSAVVPWFATMDAQRRANEINVAEAQKNRDFQSTMFNAQREANAYFQNEQLRTQREWNDLSFSRNWEMMRNQQDYLKDMASTQWQRAVGDMKAAGLSPMLAYSQGGNAAGAAVGGYTSPGQASSASSSLPGGAQGRVESGAPAAFNSAYQMAMLKENLEQTRAHTIQMQAQAKESAEHANLYYAQGDWTRTDRQRVWAEIDRVSAEVGATKAREMLYKQDMRKAVNEGNLAAVRHILLEAEIPEALVMRNSILNPEKGQYGIRESYLPYLRDILRTIGTGAGAARGLGLGR